MQQLGETHDKLMEELDDMKQKVKRNNFLH